MNILASISETVRKVSIISPFFGIAFMAALIAGTPVSEIFPKKIRESAKGIAWVVAVVSFIIGLITM